MPVYTNSATCLTANTALGTSRAARVCGLCVVAVRVRTTAGRAVNTSVTNVRRFMAGLKITNKQCLVLDPVCSFALCVLTITCGPGLHNMPATEFFKSLVFPH